MADLREHVDGKSVQSTGAIPPEGTLVALHAVAPPAGWSLRPVQASGATMSVLVAEPGAEVLTVALPDPGRRRIHVGMVWFEGHRESAFQFRVLSGHAGPWRRARPMRFMGPRPSNLQDGDLGAFNLSPGSQLQIRTEPGGYAAIAYVRLADASAEPVCSMARTGGSAGVVFDTAMTMSTYRVDEPDDLLAVLRPYVGSTIRRIFWGTTLGTYRALYQSKALGVHGMYGEPQMQSHRETCARVMRMFMDKGIDPLAMVLDFARKNGLQLWANYRISKNHEHDFRADYPGGQFLVRHQDKRVLNRDGSPHHQFTMSFAYPEIREMAVRSLLEQAEYGVEGLFIDFARKYPLAGWEPPVVEEFKQRTGKDPHRDPPATWRVDWYNHLCSYVTQFLRELRAGLCPIEERLGRRMPVAVQIPGGWRFTDSIPAAMCDAMDPFTWAREGLIDMVAPCEATALMLEWQSLDRYRQAIAGTGCELWGAIGSQFREGMEPRMDDGKFALSKADTDPWRMMALAHDLYQQGAAGVFVWEAHDLSSPPACWNVLRHIGNREHLRQVFGNKLGAFDGSHWIPSVPLV